MEITPQMYATYVLIPSFIGVMAYRIYDAVKSNWNKRQIPNEVKQ